MGHPRGPGSSLSKPQWSSSVSAVGRMKPMTEPTELFYKHINMFTALSVHPDPWDSDHHDVVLNTHQRLRSLPWCFVLGRSGDVRPKASLAGFLTGTLDVLLRGKAAGGRRSHRSYRQETQRQHLSSQIQECSPGTWHRCLT